jgi:tetratricopeptide (TPR) repeat protein
VNDLVAALNRIADELRVNRSPEELFERAKKLEFAGDIFSAEQLYKSLMQTSNCMEYCFQYGVMLLKLQRYEEALEVLLTGLEKKELPEFYSNIAYANSKLHRYKDAIYYYGKAIALRPNYYKTYNDLSLELLRTGQFEEGWKLFEYRNMFDTGFSDRYVKGRLPLWNGEDITGKRIYVSKEQGFGDAIHFIRWLPELAKKAAHVTWLCEPALLKLFRHSFDLSNVTFVDNAETIPDCDYWLYQMSLPRLVDAVEAPYLTPPYTPHIQLPEGIKVGLAWKGNPRHTNDANRSMQLAQFDCLPQNVTYVSLQKLNPDIYEISRSVLNVVEPLTKLGDFDETANIIEQLDLVISVDSSVAHLAGALGIPCWVILPYDGSDWRWGLYGSKTTHLYNDMRLFWKTGTKYEYVTQEVAKQLERFISTRLEASS